MDEQIKEHIKFIDQEILEIINEQESRFSNHEPWVKQDMESIRVRLRSLYLDRGESDDDVSNEDLVRSILELYHEYKSKSINSDSQAAAFTLGQLDGRNIYEKLRELADSFDVDYQRPS